MHILYALPYGPGVTRVRSRMILTELTARHDVTLVALAWGDEDHKALDEWRDRCSAVHAVPHAIKHRLRAMANMVHMPLQYIVSQSPEFARLSRELISDANAAGSPFDAVHVEHLRGAAAIDLLSPLGVHTVFDAVDCLAELARLTRQHGPNPVVRALAGYEQARTRRMETLLLGAADAVTVVAERDRKALVGARAIESVVVVPNGVEALARPASVRCEPAAVFTGKLSYHANQAAARWLVTDIWPRVRNIVPEATLTVAGADPPGWLMSHDGKQGIQLVPNPRNMGRVLASSRVALAPIIYSVGVQNKILEAMAAGLPVVATSSAMEGLPPLAHTTVTRADDARDFALETARLLTDDRAACRLGNAGHAYVTTHHTWSGVVRQFEELYAGYRCRKRAA